MSVIEHGRGKQKRRRPSWLAVISFVIPCMLSLLACTVYVQYKSPPPPYSGLGGLGWAIGVMGGFVVLVMGTYFGAPLSIVLAVSSLVAIRRQPERLVGRAAAVMAILMSILLVALVGVAHYKVKSAFDNSAVPYAQSIEGRTKAEVNEIETLLDDCQLYAREHSGQYPPDVIALRHWIGAKNPAAEPHFGSCIYFGGGLTEQTVAPSQQVAVDSDNPLIVWVKRCEAQNQNYIVGTMPGRGGRTRMISSTDLRRYLESCNKERLTMGLPPITENDISR